MPSSKQAAQLLQRRTGEPAAQAVPARLRQVGRMAMWSHGPSCPPTRARRLRCINRVAAPCSYLVTGGVRSMTSCNYSRSPRWARVNRITRTRQAAGRTRGRSRWPTSRSLRRPHSRRSQKDAQHRRRAHVLGTRWPSRDARHGGAGPLPCTIPGPARTVSSRTMTPARGSPCGRLVRAPLRKIPSYASSM